MPHMLKEILRDILSQQEIEKLYSSFDVIGEIVIIKIPDELIEKKHLIAQTILKSVKPVRSVFMQTSAVQGDFRIRNLEYLAGIDNTITEYRESGCRFKIDVAKAYFSPRLSTERIRIARMVCENETITNMFAGVGTFSILIAKLNSTCRVYSIDSNPDAVNMCAINVKLNKVDDRVIPICGDASSVILEQIKGRANRVLMPLPEKAKYYVSSAVMALENKRGIIHYFAHIKAQNRKLALHEGLRETENAFADYSIKIDATRVVREVGPRLYQIVSDVSVL